MCKYYITGYRIILFVISTFDNPIGNLLVVFVSNRKNVTKICLHVDFVNYTYSFLCEDKLHYALKCLGNFYMY